MKNWIVGALWIMTLLVVAAGAAEWKQDDEEQQMPEPFEAFAIDELREHARSENKTWLPFLERDSLECGVYRLAKGAEDRQQPHADDEIYYIVEGRSRFTAGDQSRAVQKGAVLFVAKEVEHRFHDIEEELVVLVFFSRFRER